MKISDWTRICDLGLSIRKSRLHGLIRTLQEELRANGIRLRPKFYLTTEYGTVIHSCNIGILWVDALDQVPALARRFGKYMHDPVVVGRVLRHEAGHAFNYVHKIWKRKDFRTLFRVRGNFFATYPDRGWSPTKMDEKRFQNGEYVNMRAMKHPDEDFSICFQTILDSKSDWTRAYRGMPVLEKLEFTRRMIGIYGERPYTNDPEDLDEPIREVKMRVRTWFKNW